MTLGSTPTITQELSKSTPPPHVTVMKPFALSSGQRAAWTLASFLTRSTGGVMLSTPNNKQHYPQCTPAAARLMYLRTVGHAPEVGCTFAGWGKHFFPPFCHPNCINQIGIEQTDCGREHVCLDGFKRSKITLSYRILCVLWKLW